MAGHESQLLWRSRPPRATPFSSQTVDLLIAFPLPPLPFFVFALLRSDMHANQQTASSARVSGQRIRIHNHTIQIVAPGHVSHLRAIGRRECSAEGYRRRHRGPVS